MDLQDQLKQLFPDHKPDPSTQEPEEETQGLWMQEDPIICKYEKRKGKPITILEGYTGATEDFKTLAKEIKTTLSVGDFRDKIMEILKDKGFQVKRVGG